MSHPAYSPGARFVPSDLISRIRPFTRQTDHEFWPDDISLCDAAAFAAERIHGAQQITGLYLLALAARHKGRLATFDKNVPISAVRAAKAGNVCLV